MVTPSAEYERFLANVADSTPSILKMRIPRQEKIYPIDLNSRKITPPPFIGVEDDHRAEYIFFEMDRFYDLIDLSDSIGMIIFKNAKNEEYYQLIPYYDIQSRYGKIIFPWVIQAPAALYSGQVSFSIKFFKIDPTSKKLIYELNTTIAKTKVLVGWANTDSKTYTYTLSPQSIIVDSDLMNGINDIVAAAKYTCIYWQDADKDIIIGEQQIEESIFEDVTVDEHDESHNIDRDENYDSI